MTAGPAGQAQSFVSTTTMRPGTATSQAGDEERVEIRPRKAAQAAQAQADATSRIRPKSSLGNWRQQEKALLEAKANGARPSTANPRPATASLRTPIAASSASSGTGGRRPSVSSGDGQHGQHHHRDSVFIAEEESSEATRTGSAAAAQPEPNPRQHNRGRRRSSGIVEMLGSTVPQAWRGSASGEQGNGSQQDGRSK
eukprot:407666-Rhodomonas_salina.1